MEWVSSGQWSLRILKALVLEVWESKDGNWPVETDRRSLSLPVEGKKKYFSG